MILNHRIKIWLIRLGFIAFFAFSCFGAIRLYFHFTDGFAVKNITSDFTYQPQWEVRPLTHDEKKEAAIALSQSYYYLGKGCQSYVFGSQDGRYVVKFFKFQRFRLQPWLSWLPPFDSVEKYRKEKKEKKWNKLNLFVTSWKIAFDNLKEESGLLLVHLNKTKNEYQPLVVYDKIGQRHSLDLDQMEFCIQKRAAPLDEVLLLYKKNGELSQAKQLVSNLINLTLSEYLRGLTDNDHALLQNTGVVDHQPIHIDIGQFLKNERFKEAAFFHQDLFTRTYRFKVWLRENDPELGEFLETRLQEMIGPAYETMQPQFHAHWEGF